MKCVSGLALCAFAFLFVGSSESELRAADLLPADRPVAAAIDHYIDLGLQQQEVDPAERTDDATLMRRLMLDLVGRTPSAAEVQQFCDDTSPDKVARLVDALMASPGYIRHSAEQFDALLMHQTGGSIRGYLEQSFREDRRWDDIFGDLVGAAEMPLPPKDEKDKEAKQQYEIRKQSLEILKRRVDDAETLTNEVSVLFFGINISCAKCHDHPLVDDWKQDHFYGMLSFFNRTFVNGDYLGERDYGSVKFKTTAGESKDARLMFLSGTVLDEPEVEEPSNEQKKEEKKRLEELKKNNQPPEPPDFSRRLQLLDVALKEGEDVYFARAIINRLFYRFYGQGLVMPLDQMHSENPPSHPDLLAWLVRDLRDSRYDLNRLVRGIVLSKAYARSSRWEGNPPWASLFAVAKVRPLMPHQLGAALRVALADPQRFAGDRPAEEIDNQLESLARSGRGLGSRFEMPTPHFQVSATEALMLSNDEGLLNDLMRDSGDRLLGRLKEIEDRDAAIDAVFWNVLSRPPSAQERKLAADYLADRAERLEDGYRQLVWALLTSAEFRFNH